MADHFMFTPQGDAYEPNGYSLALSKAVVTLIVSNCPEYAARKLSLARRFLNWTHVPGEHPRSVLEEPADQAVQRVISFLQSFDYAVAHCPKANREDEFDILVPEEKSTSHAKQLVGILRQLYQLLGSYGVGNRTKENPVELPGWHLKSEEERRDSWSARYPSITYGWINAGLRFRPTSSKPYLPLIEDPTGCGRAMTNAVIKYGCPETVIAICLVLEENGCRWREAAWANALGWSIRDFGEVVYTTNKFDDSEHAKKIYLSPEGLSGTIRRFEAQPHPTDPLKTRMDYLRELAAAGKKDKLRAIPLFPNSRGKKHQHRTFNGHWFRPAMEAWENEDGSKGLLIFSDVGSRRPTPHWYRHSVITRELEVAIGDLASELEIIEVSKAVCRRFGLKTDQAVRYAAALMRRISEEAHMRSVVARRAELIEQRDRVDIPAALSRQTLSDAERLILLMPRRQAVTA
jgi:hypothetical protein